MMSKSGAFFLEQLEQDPAFRREVELEEMQKIEPDFPAPAPENPVHFDSDEIPF